MGFLRYQKPYAAVVTPPSLPLEANVVAHFDAATPALANGATVNSWTDTVNGIVAGTAAGTKPVYSTNRANGLPSVKCAGGGGLAIATPGALKTAIDSGEYTIFIAFKTLGAPPNGLGSGALFAANAGGVGVLALVADGTNAQWGSHAPTSSSSIPFAAQTSFSTLGVTAFTTTPTGSNSGKYQGYYLNGCEVASSSASNMVTAGNTITIGSNAGNNFPVNAEIFDIIVWNTPLTPPQYMQAEKWARDKYAQAYPWAALSVFNCFFGDSLTVGVGASNFSHTAPYVAAQTLGLSIGQWCNCSVGGVAVTSVGSVTPMGLNELAPTWIDPLPAVLGKSVNLIGFEWRNQNGFTPSATTPYNVALTYLANRKAAGLRTVWGTSTGESLDPIANRTAYNTAMDGAHPNVDSYIQLHNSTDIGTSTAYTNHPANWSDTVHLSDAGYVYMAAMYVTGINAISTSTMQTGIWYGWEGTLDYPFIDQYQLSTQLWQLYGGGSVDPFLNLNANGYPSNMPSPAYGWAATFATYVPSNAAPGTSNKYVLLKDGTASITVEVAAGHPNETLVRVTGSANSARQEFLLTSTSPYGTDTNLNLYVSAVPANDWTYTKWFLASDEADLATHVTTSLFRNLYTGFERTRYMDWMETNANGNVEYSNRPLMTQKSKQGTTVQNYCGAATLSGADYTCVTAPPGNPSGVPADGQLVQFTTATNISYLITSGFSQHNPCVVSIASNTFAPSDKIMFANSASGMDAYLSGKVFTVGAVTPTSFELSGVDSTGWTISQNTIEVTKQITFKAGSLTAKPIMANTGGSLYSSQTSATDGGFNYFVNGNQRINQLIYSAELGAWTYTAIYDQVRRGMPIELIVQTANELNVGPHICIPHMANDNYVTQVATYVKNNLNSSLVATFEYSNEVWNTAFAQTTFAIKREQARGWPNGNGDYWYGYRFYQVMTLIGAVFNTQMNRINRAMACFIGAGSITNRFDGVSVTGSPGKPVSLADSIHIATYYEADRYTVSNAQRIWEYNHGTAPQKAAAITWLDNYMRDDGAVFTGTASGTTINVTSTVSGLIRAQPYGHYVYGAGIPGNCHILSVVGSVVTVSQNLGTLSSRTFTSGSSMATVKWLKDVQFPYWKAIANNPASGVPALLLEQYEGGGGQLGSLKPDDTTMYNWTTGTFATWDNSNQKWLSAYNPGSGLVDITYAEQGNFFAAYIASPEWAATVKQNWDNFIAAGGTTPAQYTMLSTWSNGAEWGVINGNIINGIRTPAYNTLVAYRG